MRRVLEFSSAATADRYRRAANDLFGYPTTRVDHRGINCPPAPFGETLNWAPVVDLEETPPKFEIEFPDALDGRSTFVDGIRTAFDRGQSVEK